MDIPGDGEFSCVASLTDSVLQTRRFPSLVSILIEKQIIGAKAKPLLRYCIFEFYLTITFFRVPSLVTTTLIPFCNLSHNIPAGL